MVHEKKQKSRQASLTEPAEDKPDSIDRTVAQAFDSDPKVRLKVAEELGKIDDPRAIFALIELSSDKDEPVKSTALRSLGKFKEEEQEAIGSLEKLFAERKEMKKPEELPQVSQRIMPSIEKLFSMRSAPAQDPLHGVEKISSAPHQPSALPDSPRQVEQEEIPRQNATNFPFGQKKEPALPQKSDYIAIEEDDREFASEEEEREIGEEELQVQNKYYHLAYRIATPPGMGKGELKREQNRLVSNFKKEVGMAFKMAEERAKEEGFVSFSNLKPGMKNLSFSEMQITGMSDIGFGARKKPFAKIRLTDGKREISVLIPSERASGITMNDRLSLKGVSADFLVESSEVVLVVKNKSKIIVVK